MTCEVHSAQLSAVLHRQDCGTAQCWPVSGYGLGLGKTVITLSAIQELKFNRWSVCKVLVIAPKKVAEATWSKESAKWDHLTGLRISTVLGNTKRRCAALARQADIYVINRDNVAWLVNHLGHSWPFDCVVLDESSSFKNHASKRFKALKAMRPRIRRLIELTGTPAPHGLIDLWAQIFLLDNGKRLGKTISVYRDIYFDPDKRNASTIWSYKLKEGAADCIYQAISDICISMKAEDYLDLPECISEDIPVVLDEQARKAYNQLENEALLQVIKEHEQEVLEAGGKISEDDDFAWITAGSAGVLTNKLLQLCNGAVYDENGDVQLIHDCKIEAFKETIEQLNGQHAIVFYNFQHDRDRIVSALASSGLRVRQYVDARDENDWNAGKIDILLAHPASCGYGLNLQQGGHHVIWFGLTWSLEQYQQGNKRLHRQGQTVPVIIHHLIVQQGVDVDVMNSLNGKENAQNNLLDALKVRIRHAKGSDKPQ